MKLGVQEEDYNKKKTKITPGHISVFLKTEFYIHFLDYEDTTVGSQFEATGRCIPRDFRRQEVELSHDNLPGTTTTQGALNS